MNMPYIQSPGVARLVRSADDELALERGRRPLAAVVQPLGQHVTPWRNLLNNRQTLIVGALLGGFFTLGLCCLIMGLASR